MGRRCAALALVPLLSGCVAAAIAVPAMTAVGALTERKHVRSPAEEAAAAEPAAAQAAAPQASQPALVSVRPGALPEPPTSGEAFEITSLTALPPPTPADIGGNPWNGFVSYALGRAAELREPARTKPAESALLAQEGIASLKAMRRPCSSPEPAVIVDLDREAGIFSPKAAGPPSPGLAGALARLREAGVVVLWISGADANRVNDVADALRRTGLDPAGRDPLLLTLKEGDRKQTMREEANEDVCVVAIAGDRRADFDELFEYLRTPDAAVGLEELMGAGWFLTPVPLTSAAAGSE